jgi:hypothetical protein
VRGAAELGWSFVGRKLGNVLVGRDDHQLEYQLLATIPFDSTRKFPIVPSLLSEFLI